jgi:EAL domain-containing protein (putative c-di-GMP-specific phosphodiesterase class I)
MDDHSGIFGFGAGTWEDRAPKPGITSALASVGRSALREPVHLTSWLSMPPPAIDRSAFHVPLGELRDALSDRLIEPRYQPIVRLSDGSLTGVEVLARLNHPVRGTILPDHFVPQMETAGLWRPLLNAVMLRGFADVSSPNLAGFDFKVAFNLPLEAVLSPSVREDFDRHCAIAGIAPNRVVIELTESHPVADLAALRIALLAWRAAGYDVSIDDIGPAVQNNRALLTLPFTMVKLDRRVVLDSAHDANAQAFLGATVVTAHANGLQVVAEGVESADDWSRMVAFGVDLAQGFVIAHPLPPGALSTWLRFWNEEGANAAVRMN